MSERILALKIHKKELTLSRLSQLVDEADHSRVNHSLTSRDSFPTCVSLDVTKILNQFLEVRSISI